MIILPLVLMGDWEKKNSCIRSVVAATIAEGLGAGAAGALPCSGLLVRPRCCCARHGVSAVQIPHFISLPKLECKFGSRQSWCTCWLERRGCVAEPQAVAQVPGNAPGQPRLARSCMWNQLWWSWAALLLGLLLLWVWPQGLKIPGSLESGVKMCNKAAATSLQTPNTSLFMSVSVSGSSKVIYLI